MIQIPSSTSISLRSFLRWLREEEELQFVWFEDQILLRTSLIRRLGADIAEGKRHELDTVRIDWQPVFSLPEEGRWPPAD